MKQKHHVGMCISRLSIISSMLFPSWCSSNWCRELYMHDVETFPLRTKETVFCLCLRKQGIIVASIIYAMQGCQPLKYFFPYFVEKISVFWVIFPYPLICSSPDSKHSLRQLPIYSGGTHPLPVETLVDYFGATGTGNWQEHRLLPHVEGRRLNVLVIKEVFEGFKA